MYMIATSGLANTCISIRRLVARLRGETRAVAMIETAVTMPVLIFAALAGLEVANLMISHTRISSVALSVADNASRISSGSNLAIPQVREIDVNDVFTGAQLQAGNLNLKPNGRIILSSLETNITGGQWISWQRCFGDKAYGSSYGAAGAGLVGNGFPGMGPAGGEVRASSGAPVMFVEVYYQYKPFMYAGWLGNQNINYTAAFTVRDARSGGIFNPSPVALVNSCGNLPPSPKDTNNEVTD